MLPSLLLVLALPNAEPARADRFADAPKVAAKIDEFLGKHWQANGIKTADLADDASFLRRVTLDLAGRVPTRDEASAFVQDRSPDKRARVIRRLMEGPEYALALGRALDDSIQGKYAGDAEFIEYLRASVAERKPWDAMFRDMMLGPWDTKERKRADRFLSRRQNSLEDLTADSASVFFGVNVSCARCHDHPLVTDWTQDHYYGMASFFARTIEGGKGKKNGEVGEKPVAEITYVTTKGERRTAKVMFLSGQTLDAAAAQGRREQLVKVALEEKAFFSKAIVNRLWAHLFGRGLVHPLDQMHSANPPSVPGVLEWLADDLVAHGYDLDRLVAGIVSSRVYQLSSAKPGSGDPPSDKDFARALLKPLTPQQYAMSLLLVTGDGTFDEAKTADARGKKYRELEGQAGGLARPGVLDGRTEKYQASTGEALFLSNRAEVQKLMAPSGKNLVARLTATPENGAMVETAVWSVLGRAPESDERTYLAEWVAGRKGDRAKACGELVWALATSAEFRFNH
ncbi:MAG TPA: DUF1549 domain-containing protein [Gemmataceae bacterium]|nr:DUF1549 domain-containing protein [Gemmataceae bacterium]